MKVLDTDTCVTILRGNMSVIERRAQTSDEVATNLLGYWSASLAPDLSSAGWVDFSDGRTLVSVVTSTRQARCVR